MVHHVVFCQLHPGVTDEKVEWIMRQTRIRMLKLPEVLAIRCGKRIEGLTSGDFIMPLTMNRWTRCRSDIVNRSSGASSRK